MDRHNTPIPYFLELPPAVTDYDSQSTDATATAADELRQALLRTTWELESTRFMAQEELRRLEAHALHLSHLLRLAARERDDALLHAHSLLLLLHHRTAAAPSSSSSEDESPLPRPPPGMDAAASAEEMEEAATRRGLPEKGRLLEAVMRAGPLLQTLMLAGPLPEWRHPPPALQNFEIPPVVASASAPRSGSNSPSPERKTLC